MRSQSSFGTFTIAALLAVTRGAAVQTPQDKALVSESHPQQQQLTVTETTAQTFCAACETCYSSGSSVSPLDECLAGMCKSNPNWVSPTDSYCWDLTANREQQVGGGSSFYPCFTKNATHEAPCRHTSPTAPVNLAAAEGAAAPQGSGAPPEPFTLPGQKDTPSNIEVTGAAAVTEGCGGICAGKGCPSGWRPIGDRIYEKKAETDKLMSLASAGPLDVTGKQRCKCICIQSASVMLAAAAEPQAPQGSGAPPEPFTLPGQKDSPSNIEVTGAAAVTEGCGGICAGKGCPAGWRAIGDRIYEKKAETDKLMSLASSSPGQHDVTGKQRCKCICIQA